MGAGGKRQEVDARIRAWESGLERLRLALAVAPDAIHAANHQRFVDLYRQKEVVKSRWEMLRGTYQPTLEMSQRFADAFAEMEAAWAAAETLRTEVLAGSPV